MNLEAYVDSKDFKNLEIPPSINMKQKQLIVRIYSGKNIVPMDNNNLADPFVKIDLGLLT